VNQWDIWNYSFSKEGEHPAVVLSPFEICNNPDVEEVNVLLASSARPIIRPPKRNEVVLDATDGLDWKTFVRCQKIYLISKSELTRRRGHVSAVRQREISRKLVEAFRLPL
jgi:mRNA-degrading endonuclease toxin of MazEF toxin-antitoxin module